MKKIFTLAAAMMVALCASAASYGIMINGTDYHAGEANPTPVDPSFQEYMVLDVQVPANATLQLYDQDNQAGWAVDLDPASVADIVRDGDHYVCANGGCFSFYIKLKWQSDQLYIGNGSCTGGNQGNDNPGNQGNDNPGNQGNQGDDMDGYYYLKGYIDGADVEGIEDWNIFEGGMLSHTFADKSYVFVIYQIDGQMGVQYMTNEYVDGPTHATLTKNGAQKLAVPAGKQTFYLYNNGDGTLELSMEPLPGKTLVGGGQQPQGFDNVNDNANVNVKKVLRNGQMVIEIDGVMFDITGSHIQ